MKIKVTFEKVYDASEFYKDCSVEMLPYLEFDQFKEGIIMDIVEYPDEIIDFMKFEEVN